MFVYHAALSKMNTEAMKPAPSAAETASPLFILVVLFLFLQHLLDDILLLEYHKNSSLLPHGHVTKPPGC